MAKKEVAPSPEHLLKMMVNFHKAQPKSMSQSDFEKHLNHTTIARYRRTMDLLQEVKKEIESHADSIGTETTTELVEKIEDSLAAAAYGSLRYNSTLRAGMDARAELWYEPSDLYDADTVTTED